MKTSLHANIYAHIYALFLYAHKISLHLWKDYLQLFS